MSIEPLLALVLFLGATWFSLLDSILAMTRDKPNDHSMVLAAFVHFTIFLYFLLASYVLYGKLVHSTIGRSPKLLSESEPFLALTWPAPIIAGVLGFALTKLTGTWRPIVPSLILLLAALGFGWWIKKHRVFRYYLVAVVTIGAFTPYMLLMSWMYADVSIRTDRDTYKRGESIVITARSEGYCFAPSIKEIEIWSLNSTPVYGDYKVPEHTETSFFRVVYAIPPNVEVEKTAIYTTQIQVVYSPQAYWSPRDQYHAVDILP